MPTGNGCVLHRDELVGRFRRSRSADPEDAPRPLASHAERKGSECCSAICAPGVRLERLAWLAATVFALSAPVPAISARIHPESNEVVTEARVEGTFMWGSTRHSTAESAGESITRGDASGTPLPERVATFSFVAVDTASGIAGVVVASTLFAVGSVVPWARAEVGAVATQSFANTTFGPEGLALLEEGRTPQEALDALLAPDAGRDQRQVGIVDAQGRSATYTGAKCMAWAGGKSGPGFAAQGNILTGPEVVDRMVESFHATAGQFLGDRLMDALEAGDVAGGDSRGRQSAALLLVQAGQGYGGFNDVLCDIRVDDHADPIKELRRVYNVWRPNQLITEGYRLVEEGKYAEAIELGKKAAELRPDSGEPLYHLACYYSRGSQPDDAMHYLEWAIRLDPSLATQAKNDPDLAPLQMRPD